MSPIDGNRSVTAAHTWAAHHRPAGVRSVGWLMVLAVHAVLLSLWWAERSVVNPPTRVVRMALVPVPPDIPEPPVPPEPPLPEPVRQPVQRPVHKPRPVPTRPAPVVKPAPAPVVVAPKPPMHRYAEPDDWVRPDDVDSGPGARRAPSDYAEAVKQRVVARVVYPANAVYPAPRGFKGDPRELMRQCTIPYEVVVDRQGQIVSYEIERCNDDLLDAAAEAAVLKAQPFPPPPDGAEQYRIYGSINFIKPRLDRAAPSSP